MSAFRKDVTTPTERYGRKVQGAGASQPDTRPGGGPDDYGHVWVVLGLLARHSTRGIVALPLLARLYVRQKNLGDIAAKHRPTFRTKLELAAELVRWAVSWLGHLGKPVWAVTDGAYAKAPFLKAMRTLAVTVVSRLRNDSALWTVPGPRAPHRRGPKRIYGEQRIDLAKRAGQQRGWANRDTKGLVSHRSTSPWDDESRRPSHADTRHGTTSLFAALNVATGAVIGRCHRRHRHQEFVKFLDHVNATVPKEPGVSVHIVLDNYATHKTAAVKRWFVRHPEYHLHFIPTSSSWLNQVERFFAATTERRIRRGVFTSVPQLERAIADYLAEHNKNPKPFVWTADADSILERLKRVCERTSDSGH